MSSRKGKSWNEWEELLISEGRFKVDDLSGHYVSYLTINNKIREIRLHKIIFITPEDSIVYSDCYTKTGNYKWTLEFKVLDVDDKGFKILLVSQDDLNEDSEEFFVYVSTGWRGDQNIALTLSGEFRKGYKYALRADKVIDDKTITGFESDTELHFKMNFVLRYLNDLENHPSWSFQANKAQSQPVNP